MTKNNSLAVVGAQWGDEGKGKIVDYLAGKATVVARYQGGNNAGHTVVVGSETFKMHHLPVGILYPGVQCVLGNGMVINPVILCREMDGLEERGVEVAGLRISGKAHVIFSFHQVMDQSAETLRGSKKIGTTGLGIGPAYADKAARRGLRMADFVDEKLFRAWLEDYLPLQNRLLTAVYGHTGFGVEEILEEYLPLSRKLAPLVTDTSLLVVKHLEQGDRVLFEGSQGTLLDIDHGTYPYVTSSSSTAGGIPAGLGIGPRYVEEIMGVIKAYTTRVGEGPFPTEETGEMGLHLREKGGEYGTTTGRPRRCGWLDLVIATYAARINGLTGWGVTKLDVLSGLETIKVAVAYRVRGEETPDMPDKFDDFATAVPVYRELPGWQEDISGARTMAELPAAARDYLTFIEDYTGVKNNLISVGPEREQTVLRGKM